MRPKLCVMDIGRSHAYECHYASPTYENIVMSIVMHAKERSMLRAKCLECVSLVGMAVGRDRNHEDAKKIMAMITQWQQDSDDPTFAYTLQAGARLCKCLGEEFLPYMDMPPLINVASEENCFEVTDEEDDGVATIQAGDKSLNIRISALEEKATACNMLRLLRSGIGAR